VKNQRANRHSKSYRPWVSMRRRCLNPRTKSFKYYGGRGITICGRWQSFRNFLADMGERPGGMTLERINNNGNYEPDNCRWATANEQQRNKRSNRLLTFQGETKTLTEWSRQIGISHSVLDHRIQSGRFDEALIFTVRLLPKGPARGSCVGRKRDKSGRWA